MNRETFALVRKLGFTPKQIQELARHETTHGHMSAKALMVQMQEENKKKRSQHFILHND